MTDPYVNVVLFSGGRGSSVLTRQLLRHPEVNLSLIINGYDDGLSTGEVRRFLGDCLGPSDFRKNASRVATELASCEAALITLLDLRFPVEISESLIEATLSRLCAKPAQNETPFFADVEKLLSDFSPDSVERIRQRMEAFSTALEESEDGFDFSDCSIGNLVFAGCFLVCHRDFNRAVDDYCKLLGLDPGLILNVTQGENAFLVATNQDGVYLKSEAEIVDAGRRNHIQDIFLVDRPLEVQGEVQREMQGEGRASDAIRADLARYGSKLRLNPDAVGAIAKADLMVYAPGTQHSSLFPSYMTPGLGHEIAKNTHSLKLLVTNIEEDAEIPDFNAVEIIDKAVFYLREKNSKEYPVSALLTHYLVNRPEHRQNQSEKNYIPLGNMETIEDPRLIRIGNYEDESTGNHDPQKVLGPFIDDIARKKHRTSVAVVLTDNTSANKTVQTVLEIARSDHPLSCEVTVYYQGKAIDYLQTIDLPFGVQNVETENHQDFMKYVMGQNDEYVCLMECSGMYYGHDVTSLIANLNVPCVDAVWGSRRLSKSDVLASYKFRYHHHVLLGITSYLGSYFLSLTYLFLYGRYVSDTLCGLRLIRRDFLARNQHRFNQESFNQYLLGDLLKSQGRVFEVPVDFLPMSPEKVKRTGLTEGLRAFWVIMTQRIKHWF